MCLNQSEFTFCSLITSSLIIQPYWKKNEIDDGNDRGLFVTDGNDWFVHLFGLYFAS